MAVKTYLLASGNNAEGFAALVDGVDQAAASRTDGWTVGKIASAESSFFKAGTKQATGTFSLESSVSKPGASDSPTTQAGSSFRTPAPLNGTFASGTWTAVFAMRASTASSQRGRVRMRLWKSANADGSSGTQLDAGAGVKIGSTSTALSTTVDVTSTIPTWNPGAFTLTDEFLFFVLAWEITTASGSNNGDVLFRTGTSTTGTHFITADFTPVFIASPVVATLQAVNRSAVW